MHENPDLQQSENDEAAELQQQGVWATASAQEDPENTLGEETEETDAEIAEEKHTSLVTLFVDSEGLDDARTLLNAWVPAVPLSIILLVSEEAHISYFEHNLTSTEAFTVSVVSERTDIQAGHIYLLGPHASFRFDETEIHVIEEPQTEQALGDSFLTSFGEVQRKKALVLFFAAHIDQQINAIKLLSGYHASMVHHSRSHPETTPHTEIPVHHLVEQSDSLEQVAVYTQRFIESFNPDAISELAQLEESTSYVQHITSILSDHTSSSFTHYTPSHVLFHVFQRLRIYGLSSIHSYIEYLASNPKEISIISKRIALKNTYFFNDLRSLRVIAKTIIPSLVKESGPEQVIRVWVPGSSTGEDLLSLSMLIHEHAESAQSGTKVRLLGSDNNEKLLQFARKPRYTHRGVLPTPQILTDKFFKVKEALFEFKPDYLEQCHISLLHPVAAPPYANLDVIYCKGLLDILTPEAQETLMKHFKEALSPRGVLVIGSAEAGNREIPLFAPVKNQPCVFKPIQATIKKSSRASSINLFKNQGELSKSSRKSADKPKKPRTQPGLSGSLENSSVHTLHKDLLLQIQAPVSLMIRKDFTIVDHIGNVGRFIAWPNNGHTKNMLEAFPKEVQDDLRFAVNQVIKSNIALKSRPIKTDFEGIFREFRLQVHPIKLNDSEKDLIQVIFLETDSSVAKNTPLTQTSDDKQDTEVKKLEGELQETKEKLKVVTGLLKDSKELLKQSKEREKEASEQPSQLQGQQTANTEDQAKVLRQNEELRSTNRELLELNRDLVRRIEELRRSMNRKLKELEQAQAAKPAQSDSESATASGLTKHLELLLPKRHEVRTSLTSIIGFSDLLADRIVDKDNRELARYIGKSGHRLSENLAPLLNLDFKDDEEEEEQLEEAPGSEQDIISSDRVLVVEDSEATRRLLTLVLSDKFECEVAADGSEAIEKAEKEIFKAVLLDIDLGKGPNGIDVLDHLRQKNYYRTVPFMAVTSMATPQDRSMLLRKGFDAFVPKPFQKGQLLSTLDKIIDNSGIIA